MTPIETGIPEPQREQKAVMTSFGVPFHLSSMLDLLLPGQSFVVDSFEMRRYAMKRGDDKGLRLTSEKQPDGRYRIWRKSE